MLPYQLIVVLFAGLGNVLLALFTLLKNPKSATNRAFFLFSISIVTYLLINSQVSVQTTDSGALFWVEMVMSNALFINVLFFLLAYVFPHPKITLKPLWVGLALVSTIILIGAVNLNLVFTSAQAFGANGTPGPAMPFFLLHTLIFLGGGFFNLVKKIRKTTGLERTQILLFLIAAVVMFLLILTTNLFFVLVLHTGAFIGLLPIYTLIFLGIISYAIIRHRFLDIRLVVVRAVAYVALVAVVSLSYSLLLFSLTRVITKDEVPLTQLIISTVLVLIITFSFRLVKNTLERITKNILYHQTYDSQLLLQQLSNILASTLELSDLTGKVLQLLKGNLNISALSVVLVDKDAITFTKSFGLDEEIVIHGKDVELAQMVKNASRQTEAILVFEELNESELKDQMRQHRIGIILPLVVDNELIGGILLGNKASGEIYSSEDIRLLETFAPQLAVAAQNSLSYEEIRRFNITLKDEIKKATAELQDANERLQELDKLKDEFVSLASHELRTPMTSIKGSISAILEGYAGAITDDTKKYLTAAFNENDRLIRLVNNLLNSSRIEAGRFTFTVTDVDLHQVIKEIVANMQMAAQEKNVYLKYEGADAPLMVKADNDKIREVIINFIGNALKFTTTGGITVTAVEKDGQIVTSVKDTGPGMKPEDLQLLFKKFSQVKSGDDSKPAGGTGLGLYISKQIVEGLQGKIWVESVVGQGSTFAFALPKVGGTVETNKISDAVSPTLP